MYLDEIFQQDNAPANSSLLAEQRFEDMYLDEVFQQDNAPAHVSAKTNVFLAEHGMEFYGRLASSVIRHQFYRNFVEFFENPSWPKTPINRRRTHKVHLRRICENSERLYQKAVREYSPEVICGSKKKWRAYQVLI